MALALAHSSVIVTTTAVDTRIRDRLSFTFTARPQAMTVYVRFVEGGSILMTNAFVLSIGSGGARFNLISTGSFYRVRHFNSAGGPQVEATLAVAPSVGDTVELAGQLSATGAVTLIQSINGAATTTTAASAALTLSQTWVSAVITLNEENGANFGINAFRNVEIVAGVKTMQEMRRLAGTD